MIDYSTAQILLLEDSEDDAFFFRKVLPQHLQDKIVHLTDGHKGFNFLAGKEDYEGVNLSSLRLILLDVKMPIMGGIELLEKLKDEDLHQRTPKMFFTSSERPNDVDRAYELGACAYFTKPSSISQYKPIVSLISQFWIDYNLFS